MEYQQYVLFYHPIGFRDNLIRCILSYRDIPYTEQSPANVDDAVKGLFMSPPILYDIAHEFHVSQTQAIVTYLARAHGLAPASSLKLATAEMIVADCVDVLNEVTSGCGATKANWDEFRDHRFMKWLHIMESVAIKEGLRPDNGYFLGTSQATFADTSVFAVWATLERSIPALSEIMRTHAPCVMALCDRLGDNPGLMALTAAQLAVPYCGGQIEVQQFAVTIRNTVFAASKTILKSSS